MSMATLLYTGLLALGIFTFDAYLHPDVIGLTFNLPKGLGASETSLGDQVAENLFLGEVTGIDAVPTFVAKPRVRSTNEASPVALVGEMLGLRRLTLMIQQVTGLEPLVITASLTKRGDRYQLILVSNPEASPDHRLALTIESAVGEPLSALIRRGAISAMLKYEDYLVCLYLVEKSERGDLATYESSLPAPGVAGLDALIRQRLEMLPTGLAALPLTNQIAKRRAMFTNLRGELALQQGNDGAAADLFEDALRQSPDFAIAALNLAFVRVHQDRYAEAIDLSRRLTVGDLLDRDPVLVAAAHTTWGVAAWGLGHTDEAADQFQLANDAYPHATLANLYWSEMLATLGNAQEADARRRRAAENVPYFENYAETAMLHFRLSPTNNAPLSPL